MEKPWFPQRNYQDSIFALLKTLFFHLEIRVSYSTLEQIIKRQPSYPNLTINSLEQILFDCGLKTITAEMGSTTQFDLKPFSLLYIKDAEGQNIVGQFVILYALKQGKIEYLHSRKGWITEDFSEFEKKWSKLAVLLMEPVPEKWETDFVEKQKEFEENKFKNPELKNIKLMDNFLTSEECDYVVSLANPILQPSKLFGEKREIGHGRTSYSAEFHIYPDDKILNRIRQKAAKILEMPESHFEAFQCVSYEQGQEYQVHYDTFDENIPANKAELERGGQRKYTMLAYLNDDYDGGSTFFPNLDLMVRPKKGRVVIFNNLDEAGKVIPAAFHAGLPVTVGRKYAINIWVRNKPQSN